MPLDLAGNQSYMSHVAARGEVVFEVTFGPSSSSFLPRALAYAKAHAEEVLEQGPGVWRASFRLGGGERAYGEALQLFLMVRGWRATMVEVDGSPERLKAALLMLHCAREWLRTEAACREGFPTARGWPKCRLCPLYDHEWAAESGPPRFMLPVFGPDAEELGPQIPDHLPEDWEEG